MKQDQIDSMILAARLLGDTRGAGITDDEAVKRLAAALVREDNRRLARDPELSGARAQEMEVALSRAGLAMDESDLKGSGQILREDNENMGYADYAEFEAAQREGKAALALDEELVEAREKLKRAETKLAEAKSARDKKFWSGVRERNVLRLQKAESAARDYAFGMNVYAAEGEDERPGALQDQMLRERQRRAKRGGQTGVVQGARFYADAEDAPVPVRGGLEPPRFQREPGGGLSQAELREGRRQKLLEFVEGQGAKAQEERFFRGDLTEREMSERARLEAGQREFDPTQTSSPPIGVRDRSIEVQLPMGRGVLIEDRTVPQGVGREGTPVPISRQGFNSPSTSEVAEGILAQLRSRKERNRKGTVDRIMRRNNVEAAADAADLFHDGGGMEAKARLMGLPNISVLGQLKGDKLKRDMGLQLGNQRVSFPEAVRIERPDGSYEYYDANKDVIGDLSLNGQPLPGQQAITTAETINAPIPGETAEAFVQRNIYDNYGAQFFGDENIVANLGDTGSGGGIPQVSITGELSALESAVAKKTGQPMSIRTIENLQQAANSVIAAEKAKGNVLFTMQDGKKVASENPGLAEAMWALKIPPAQQQAIANALYQSEAARRQNVDLDAKETYFSGGRGRRTAWDGKAIITDVNDPGRGGDRLEYQKADGKFGPALRAGGLTPDAAKPFVGALVDDPPARTIQNNAQVYRGMDPVEVRLYQERQSRINAAKRKRQGKEPKEFDVVRTRQMQEGNVMAQFRAMQAQANRDAQDRVMLGEVRPGRPVPAALKGDMVQLPGTLPKAPAADAKLLPRPVRDTSGDYRFPVRRPMKGSIKPGPGELTAAEKKRRKQYERPRPSTAINENPTVESYPTIELPAGYKGRQAEPTREERVNSIMDKVKNVTSVDPRNLPSFGDFRTKPEYQRGRRIAYGGGGLAALAGILGLSNINREEEEQY